MKDVLIVGATGMVGGIILRNCLESPEIESVISLTRETRGQDHPKLKEIIHEDFINFDGKESFFSGVDIAFYCIGVYTGQVSDEQFKKITVDMTRSFADVLKDNSPCVTLCFLSGQGADLKEKSRVSFSRYKGMAENYLLKKEFGGLYIFRPAYIYPVEERVEPNWSYRLFRSVYPVLKHVFPKSAITSEQLGVAMFRAGLKGADRTILENEDIKRIL